MAGEDHPIYPDPPTPVSATGEGSDGQPTPVFGLTRRQLAPVVEAVAGRKLRAFHAAVSCPPPAGKSGHGPESAVVEFTFAEPSGRERSVTVFAKRYHDPGPREAHHYDWLSRPGAPVPRCYGGILDPAACEVLFLEYLEAPNLDAELFASEPACRAFFTALARFNATPVPEAALDLLPRHDWARRLGSTGVWGGRRGYWPAGRVLEEILDHEHDTPCDDRLGRFCTAPEAPLRQLQLGAQGLAEPIGRMARGLVHDDFRAAQTGWRRTSREVVIYDLEFVGLGPRFHDAATVLGQPDEDQTFCLPRRELARGYLEEYARAGGEPPPLDVFLAEVKTLHLAHRLSVLGWWPDYVFDPPEVPHQTEQERTEERRARRDHLCDWLSFLLDGVRSWRWDREG